MSFGYFMNMEKVALSISEKHILSMTDNNYGDDDFLDMDILINNIENGFVVLTQLSSYFESFLNTIINRCMNYDGEKLLKCSVEEKMDLIFIYYKKDFKNIKGQNPWSIYKNATNVRNEMIHYKNTYIGNGGGIPNFKIGKQYVGEFFTQKNMKILRDGHEELATLVASTLGLSIYKNIDIFECDGRDGMVNYVYDKENFCGVEVIRD